ncbi:serine/threonine-protein kinase [Streptosporangium sp. KLBMP 9127]|nr:serine/threonine-protein kinase [Streptosporangium sp. KLBMP 9127]
MTAPSHAGRYRIDQVIGVGGFASVHLGHDDELRSPVAVKILADNWSRQPHIRERFLQEARLLRKADSHRLVQVFDLGELDDGRPYFVMTYADKGTLEERLAGAPMGVAETIEVIGEICQGVSVLHSIGVVHRDLKPSNVLFCSRPEGGERVMVADLGIARSTDHLSGLTLPAGSPGYQAPEQLHFDGAPDARADVHGLGALTYHMLTGRVPGKPTDRVPPSALRPDVPPAVDEAVMRALAPDREDRWSDAATYVAALTGTTPVPLAVAPISPVTAVKPRAGDVPPGESADETPDDAPRRRPRRVLTLSLLAAAAVIAITAGSVALLRGQDPIAPPPDSTASPSDGTAQWLREDSDIPREYRAWIVKAGTNCKLKGLSPALIAAMLKAESGFDPNLNDPENAEFGIARWTPEVLWHWQPGGLAAPLPKPPLGAEVSITSMGRFMCHLGPQIADVPGDPALNLAGLFRSGVEPMHRSNGVPKKWLDHTSKVKTYMADYLPK